MHTTTPDQAHGPGEQQLPSSRQAQPPASAGCTNPQVRDHEGRQLHPEGSGEPLASGGGVDLAEGSDAPPTDQKVGGSSPSERADIPTR